WRKITQPSTGDDILRVERPDGWMPDYSPKTLEENKKKYNEFSYRLKNIPRENWSRSDSVDYLLMHSAIERVNWELNVLRSPYRNPDFYVHQTLGAVYELLIIHSPMTDSRTNNIIIRLQSIPITVEYAKQNLTEAAEPFALVALDNLSDISNRLYKMLDGLFLITESQFNDTLIAAVENAVISLEDYKKWIKDNLQSMTKSFNVGRENYVYFLRNIALMPYLPEELLLMGNTEWNRSVSFDVFERERNSGIPELPIFSSSQEQIAKEKEFEEEIRKFLVEKDIMSVPDWVNHYINKKIPPHIEPFTNMGVVDDLTSETRLDEDGVSYIPEPSPNLSYFRIATARDPRPIIIHEGVPGHYFQMVLSWANPNPIRRRFFDSGPNEGIAFYVEELLLQYGLFEDSPKTREIIYSFMRLRALRVDVDINLALGNYSIEDAGHYLAKTVPMDLATGIGEARFFAYNPGQAITYQIGKIQILNLIADAKILQGDNFILKDYHDYMMQNGNVPIALQRWEYLGLTDEIDKLWPEN
ncbi:MAG: DUF885 domain-containing protein, partial [Ignavibacteria bacterium]|nr:DUF885 domain-containing protein [Ignavibacteria bacterium]